MTSSNPKSLNGVPVDACLGLVKHVQNNAEAGKTVWRSTTRWNGGFQCQSQIRDHTVHMDEPRQLGGTDSAPNMVEMVLAAYGSCLTVGYTLNAAVRGIELKDLSVDVEGDLDLAGFFGLSSAVPAGFSAVRANVRIDADASDEDIRSLHDHVLKTSPVGSILGGALPVTTLIVDR